MSIDVRAQRREQILEAAKLEFEEKGFDRAKMGEIARRAGIGKSTVYEYFPSKEELLIEVLHYGMEHLNEALSAYLCRTEPLRDTLAGLLGKDGREMGKAIFPVARNCQSCPPVIAFMRKCGQQEVQFIMGRLEERINRAVDEGEVRDDLDAQFAAGIAFSLMMATDFSINRSAVRREEYAYRVVDLLFEGICPRKV